MKAWQADVLRAVDDARDEHGVFQAVEQAARDLGFDHAAYGLRLPLPLAHPRVHTLSNYPDAWQARYAEAGYLAIDPTVAHGRRSRAPVVWSDALFAHAQPLWSEAQSMGLRVGWAQSSVDARGVAGMLTLARRTRVLSARELAAKELKMCWLACAAHLALSQRLGAACQPAPPLTEREIEVMRWTADGKTSEEIARILIISVNTVNFHVRNVIAKLKTANKTAAVVTAVLLGLLN